MNTRRKPPRRVLRRPPATVDQAVAVAARGQDPAGSSALVICTRVGDADFVPPRYGTADCSQCGAPCWLNPDVVEPTESRGMTVRPISFRCLGPTEGRSAQ
jgi:hypothetical protein